MFLNIPLELRQRPQWVTWKQELTDAGKPTKVPYNPRTGGMAMSNNPETWVTFDYAVAAYNAGGYSGIGFMLSDGDEYTFVDLDDPYQVDAAIGQPKFKDPVAITKVQAEVYQKFIGTYAEFSPSGKGLHIISKGISPKGRRKAAVEMYSSVRFMTMTGNVFANYPVENRQEAITWLYNEMGGDEVAPSYGGGGPEVYSDQEIVDRALRAQNGQKFSDLANGNWQLHYTSQSEADFALINILAFHSQNQFQVARIFRYSALGQRTKADRDNYVLPMVQRAYDLMPPPIDHDAMRAALDAQFAAEVGKGGGALPALERVASAAFQAPPVYVAPTATGWENAQPHIPPAPEEDNPYHAPVPGLLGSIAAWIYAGAPRPVAEIALAGAIGLMAGICGRAFNVSGTGLNQYTLLLANTGRGKEAIASGITKLMTQVISIDGGGCPAARDFIGPEFASGQALVKHIDKVSRSFISYQGEFDNFLKNVTSRNANAGLVKLKAELLNLYGKSGRGETSTAVAYADKDNNSLASMSPSVSIIGEGTPGKFYAMLDETMVQDGLLPRFTVIEYNGDRVPLNRNRQFQPSPELVKMVAQLCGYCIMLNQQNRAIDVAMTPEADAILHQFDITVDGIMNRAGNDTVEELWNRAFLKAAKLAALVAVGVNPSNPTIDATTAQYAINLVKRDTARLVTKFASGDVGDGFMKQQSDFRAAFNVGLRLNDNRLFDLGMTRDMMAAGWVSHRFLQQTLANKVSFKHAKEGAPRALETVIRTLVDGDVIGQVGASDLAKFGKDRGKFYAVRSLSWLSGN